MYVLDVIPFSRTAPGVLSYRSVKRLEPGSIVEVMLRRTKTQGIVISATPVEEAKEYLKNVRFQLSKSAPSLAGALPEPLMRAAERVAQYHATSVGSVLTALFSEQIRAGVPFSTDVFTLGSAFLEEAVELAIPGRVARYASQAALDTECGAATLLVVPTIAETLFWKRELIAHKPIVLSGTVTGNRRAIALERAGSHKGLIITTPSFSWVPIQNLGSIIVERASAGTYVLPKRPHLNMPIALKELAMARSVPFLIGDLPLPLELRPNPEAPLNLSAAEARIHCIDARTDESIQTDERVPFAALPLPVIDAIKKQVAEGGRVIVIAVRKGYAPAVVCRDCGQSQIDERGLPYSFTQQGERRFVTSDGASSIAAQRKCTRCESWNLLPLGVGIERVEEELKKAFPASRIVAAHAELLTTPKKAAALVSDGLSPGSILIGTESLMPWLYLYAPKEAQTLQKPLGVIASADSLLALPFWRARERFIRLCYLLSGVCDEVLLVTRRPEDAAVEEVLHPHKAAFWKEETQLRRSLRYPPFGRLISITIEDAAPRAHELAARITEEVQKLAKYTPIALEERLISPRLVRIPLLIQVPEAGWPHPALSAYLGSLPPTARVRIDPDALW